MVILTAFSTCSFAAAKEIGNGYEDDPWIVQYKKEVNAYLRDDVLYFKGKGNIDEVYIRYSTKMIRMYSAVEILEGVASICPNAFSGDKNIEWVSLAKTVKSVGKNAFSGCTSLTDVYYAGSEEEWQAVTVAEGNGYLTDAAIHFNGEGEKKQFTEHKTYSISVASQYLPTDPEIRKSGSALRVGNTVKIGDEIDFTHTFYSPRVDLYATSSDNVLLESLTNPGNTKLTVGGTAKDPSILEWKVRKVDPKTGIVELYGSVRASGIKLKETGAILAVNSTVNVGDIIDFGDVNGGGSIIYKAPANSGIADISEEGSELAVKNFDTYDPAVTQWKVTALDHQSGQLELTPSKYAKGFSAAGKGFGAGTTLPIQDTVTFPSSAKTASVKYYKDENAAEPYKTLSVAGGVGKLEIPSDAGVDVKAWKVKSVDIQKNTISVYPYGINGGTYDLINYSAEHPAVYYGELKEGKVIERGVTVENGSKWCAKFATPSINSADIEYINWATNAKIEPPNECADVRYWKVKSIVESVRVVFLEPLYDACPTFNKMFPDPKEGEKGLPWQIGADGSDIKAYIEGTALNIEGSGTMIDLVDAPWADRVRDIEIVDVRGDIKNIGAYAFDGMENAWKISIPDSVEIIEAGAFRNCASISSIKLSDNVKKIGYYAFSNCSAAKILELGTGVKEILSGAFSGDSFSYSMYKGSASSWKNVKVESGNSALDDIMFYSNSASVFSGVNWVLIAGIAAVLAACGVVVFSLKKKKHNSDNPQ